MILLLLAALGGLVPAGWVPLEAEPSPADRTCSVFFSRDDWRVNATPHGISVTPVKFCEEQHDSLPFAIPPANRMQGCRRVAQVKDGWIVGFDAGEFDGSLWWFSSDGRSRRDLLPATFDEHHPERWFPQNVRAIVRLRDALLAFQGLNHLGLNVGRVVAISSAPSHDARVVALLPAAPAGATLDGPDHALVVTDLGVLAVDARGNLSIVANADFRVTGPTSIAKASTGEIFVGMRHFVARITRTEQRTDVTWLAPSGCSAITQRGEACVCLPAPKPGAK